MAIGRREPPPPNGGVNRPTGTPPSPLTGASSACKVGTNRDSALMAIDRLLDVRATVATDDGAVYRTDGDASVNVCLSQPAA